MKEINHAILAKFIFNIDEAGCSNWDDRHYTKVLVPCEYDNNKIPIQEDRNSKRLSSMKPLIIVHRITVDNDIKLAGYNEDSALFSCQNSGLMTAKLFLKWSKDIFFPELVKNE